MEKPKTFRCANCLAACDDTGEMDMDGVKYVFCKPDCVTLWMSNRGFNKQLQEIANTFNGRIVT